MANDRRNNQRGRRGGGGASTRRRHQQAWAPYNFVPMPDKPLYAELDRDGKLPRHNVYVHNRHTGYFRVKLTTETPLFIRGMLTGTEKEAGIEMRKHPDFFGLRGQAPVIPGSSLRGMLRNLVEIVTNSKMHFVSDNKLVYRSVFGRDSLAQDYRNIITDDLGSKEFMYPSQQMHGGYLQKGDSESGWVIQPAKAPYGDSIALVEREDVLQAGFRDGEKDRLKTYKVGIKPPRTRTTVVGKQGVRLQIALAQGISKKTGSGYEPGTLIISSTVGRVGGKGGNRHWYPAIYEKSANEADAIPISQQIWNDFKLDRDLKRGIPNRIIDEGDVLFYLLDNRGRLLFFGPTMFFRIPYQKSIGSLIPKTLQQQNPQVDYAEAMFGYVSEKGEDKKQSAYAGRISVSSAYVTEERDSYIYDPIVPKILGSPKPTTFQHYLEQPDGWQTPTHQLRHYGDDTDIRGHKLYWRQKISSLAQVVETDKTKNPETSSQHTLISPVREDVTFAFKIHFENLSDAELGALIWVLTLGGDEQARHQLGMGKPLGLGVVRLKPELVMTVRHGENGRYSRLFDSNGRWFTNEQPVSEDAQNQWVTTFKQTVGNFDNQQSIKELKVLLRMQEPNEKFNYMQIEPENDYQGRPVLPYPTEIEGGVYND